MSRYPERDDVTGIYQIHTLPLKYAGQLKAAVDLAEMCRNHGVRGLKNNPIYIDLLVLVKEYAPEGIDHNIYYDPRGLNGNICEPMMVMTWKTPLEGVVSDHD